ncbi:MAG: shikimate kinase [Deltaproteobacteria bacterium]|nr:MAG: shikimate kinase [Deltaproteobacteria bacterium]
MYHQQRQDNLVLTGFMGTGKTTVGRLLSRSMVREFIDTDQLIVERQGLSIAEIFRQFGEEVFRRLESEVATELALRDNLVIATGGRMLLDPDNATRLSCKGHIFCLTASVDAIFQRIRQDGENNRPLLQGKDPKATITALLREREPGYSHFLQIDTTGKSPQEAASALLKKFQALPVKGPKEGDETIDANRPESSQ